MQVQTVTGPDGQPAGAGSAAPTPGGPAATAGLQAHDVIIKVNRTATPDTETLAAVLAGLRPGQQVPVAVTRAGPQRDLALAMVCNRGTGTPIGDLRLAALGATLARAPGLRPPR